MDGSRGRHDRMIVGFTTSSVTTYAISSYHL
jgi:hypothetical protein